MTWLSTWPTRDDRPHFAEHDTEAQAKAHASELRVAGYREAVDFWSEAAEVAAA